MAQNRRRHSRSFSRSHGYDDARPPGRDSGLTPESSRRTQSGSVSRDRYSSLRPEYVNRGGVGHEVRHDEPRGRRVSSLLRTPVDSGPVPRPSSLRPEPNSRNKEGASSRPRADSARPASTRYDRFDHVSHSTSRDAPEAHASLPHRAARNSSSRDAPRNAQALVRGAVGNLEDHFCTPQNNHFYETFRYLPLDRDRLQIRLLHIDGDGSGKHVLRQQISLASPPSYCALSYVAGSPNNTARVLVNGHIFKAFANLQKAIEDAREFWKIEFPRRPLFLWVDQICINQSDHTERSHQVGYMREIYRRAEHVIIPLRCDAQSHVPGGRNGIPVQSRDFAVFNLWVTGSRPRVLTNRTEPVDLRNIPAMPEAFSSATPRKWFGFAADDKPRKEARKTLNSVLDQLAGGWRFIRNILEHPWWRRAWVYQEFILNSRTWFVISTQDRALRLEWERLYDVFQACMNNHADWSDGYIRNTVLELNKTSQWDSSHDAMRQRKRLLNNFIDDLQDVKVLWPTVSWIFRSKIDWSGEGTLSSLLKHARQCDSSDPRDRIYAFIGLASSRYRIVPDYNPMRSMTGLLLDTAQSIVSVEGRLDVLAEATAKSRSPQTDSPLPSWLPNWTQQVSPSHAQFLKGIRLPLNCNASNGQLAEFRLHRDDSRPSQSILEVRGLYIGTLTNVEWENVRSEWRWYSCHTRGAASTLSVATRSVAQAGDEIWVIYGAKWPFAVRRAGEYFGLLGLAMLREPIRAWSHDSAPAPWNGEICHIMYGSAVHGGSHQYSTMMRLV